MHSYQHNIKTFNNATRHLTRVERSLYRDLIELYYDNEQPLNSVDIDRLAKRVLAVTDEEKEALRYILDEFFELDGDFYTHQYCDEQIDSYRANKSAKAAAGRASAEKRREKAESRKQQRISESSSSVEQNATGVQQPLNGCATNKKPVTSNHKPITSNKNKQKKSASPQLDYSGLLCSDDQIQEIVRIRKRNSKNPKSAALTQRIVDSLANEFASARANGWSTDEIITEWETRGWQTVKSEWIGVKNTILSRGQANKTTQNGSGLRQKSFGLVMNANTAGGNLIDSTAITGSYSGGVILHG